MNGRGMKRIVLAALVCAAAGALADVGKSTPKGFSDDFDASVKAAEKSGKNLWVLFTGSDWCYWCKKLEKEAVSKPEFAVEGAKRFELVFLDFPNDKSRVRPELANRNRALAAKFGVRGYPTIVLAGPAGEKLMTARRPQAGEDFAAYFDGQLKKAKFAPQIAKMIAPYEKEFEALQKEWAAKASDAFKGIDHEDAAQFNGALDGLKKDAPGFRARAKEIRKRFRAEDVPEELSEEKEELLDGMFGFIKELRLLAEGKRDRKADGEGGVRREARRPRVVLPAAKDAKVDADYFRTVAMPFWTRHLVDACRPGADADEKTAAEVRKIRVALARMLATADPRHPSGGELALATSLWNRKSRDAAVALFHYLEMSEDSMYWHGEGVLKEAAAKHDFANDPVTGFVLRLYQLKQLEYRRKRSAKDTPLKRIQDAGKTVVESFRPVAETFKAADRRILERLSQLQMLPIEVVNLAENDYLLHCELGDAGIAAAFESRGSDWARNVTEEGWKGFDLGIKSAESNFLAAARLRPEEARPAMGLARLYGCSCGANGEAFAWFNRGVSNSLDAAALGMDGFVHFQTSRWGGSTRTLYDVVFQCATNVDVRSAFSWRTAAYAIQEIFVAETDGSSREGLVDRVITDELAAALYSMFEKYAAAPENEFLHSRDTFVGMGMSLALLKRDWEKVGEWRGRILSESGRTSLASYEDAKFMHMVNKALDSPYLRYMNEILICSARADDFIAAEKAFAAGDLKSAFEAYERLNGIPHPTEAEKFVVGHRYFDIRTALQEREGGWVDLMPTTRGGEAVVWWGFTLSDKDGRARIRDNSKSYYRVNRAFQGIGAEYEATVHFERKNKSQKVWNIGFGLARIFSGYCAENNSFSYPYVAFWRDEKGDHAAVESFTAENSGNKPSDNDKKMRDVGRLPEFTVWTGDLEPKDDHAFRIRTTDGLLRVDVDGQEVYSVPLDEIRGLELYRCRIQPDGKVQPIWKLFSNTAFSNYRYRIVEAL